MLAAPRRVQTAAQLARQVQWRALSTSPAAFAGGDDSSQSKLRSVLKMPDVRSRRTGAPSAAPKPVPRRTPENGSAPPSRRFLFNRDGAARGETNAREPSSGRGSAGARGASNRDSRARDGERRDFRQRDGQRRSFPPRDGERRDSRAREFQPRRDSRQQGARDASPRRDPQLQKQQDIPPAERAEEAESPEFAEAAVDSETAQAEGAEALDLDATDDTKTAFAERVGRKLQKRRQLRSDHTTKVNEKARKSVSEESMLDEPHRPKSVTHARTAVRTIDNAVDEEADPLPLDDVIDDPIDAAAETEESEPLERALLARKTVAVGSNRPKLSTEAEKNLQEMEGIAVDRGPKGHYQLVSAWPRPGEYHSKLRLEHPVTNWNDPIYQETSTYYGQRQALTHKLVGAPVVPHFPNTKGFKYDGPTYSSSAPGAKQKKGLALEKDYASPEAMKPFSVPHNLSMKFALHHYQVSLPQGLAWPEPKLARPRYMNLTEDKPNVSKGSTPTFSDNPAPEGPEQWSKTSEDLNKDHATAQEARLADIEGVDPALIKKAYPAHTIWRAAEVKRREILEAKGGDYSQYVVKPLTLAQLGLDPKDPNKEGKLSTGQRALHNARSALSLNNRVTLDGKEYSSKAIQSRVADIP